MSPSSKRAVPSSWICAALAAAVAAVFGRSLRFDFVTYDDPWYVSENPHVLGGLSVDALRWALTSSHATNWHPLTWISHMLDVAMFGLDPSGHHLTSVALHGLSTVLLFLRKRPVKRG